MDIKYYIMKWNGNAHDMEYQAAPTVKEESVEVHHNKFRLTPSIKNIQSLISIAKSGIEYSNIDMDVLQNILPDLEILNNLVGVEKLKETILYQIVFFLLKLHTPNDYLNAVITGQPGTGKTTIAKILGNIYKHLGILSKNGVFKIATREDFIGQYLGHTAEKTKKLLNECKGGILFIDEAYSLGPGQKDKDSFSKEAIDTLNLFLSEHKQDICCIIAGYEDELKRCFFNMNQGLERRFQWIHKIDTYTHKELTIMLLQKLKKDHWKMNIDINRLLDIVEKHMKYFKNMGGDVEKFITNLKLVHAKRIFSLDIHHKKIITETDITEAFRLTTANHLSTKNEKGQLQHLYI